MIDFDRMKPQARAEERRILGTLAPHADLLTRLGDCAILRVTASPRV